MPRTLNDFQKAFIQLKNAEPVYLLEITELINQGNQYGYLSTIPVTIGSTTYKDVLTSKAIKLTSPYHADVWDKARNKIPQLSFEISNASNIAKEILEYDLINTQVQYYILDNTALVQANRLRLFDGHIKSCNYNNNKIVFKCVLSPQLYNKVIPSSDFTKEEYPTIETKFIGQPKQIVYGDYMTPSGDDVSNPSQDFYLKRGCRLTIPSILVDKANYKYVFAGHTIDHFNAMTGPDGTGSSMIIKETGNDQLIKIYDPSYGYSGDETSWFTLSDEAQLRGYIRPSEYEYEFEGEGDYKDEVHKALDSDGLLAGELNTTYAELGQGYHWFTFENFGLDSDYYVTEIRLVADIQRKVTGENSFVFTIKTDGEQQRWNSIHLLEGGEGRAWVDETEENENTPTIYRIRCHTINDFTVINPTTREYVSVDMFKDLGIKIIKGDETYNALQCDSPVDFYATYFPLHNLSDYLTEFNEDNRNNPDNFSFPWRSTAPEYPTGRFINFEKLSRYKVGIRVVGGLIRLKNFHIQFHGVYLKGGRKVKKIEYTAPKVEPVGYEYWVGGIRPKFELIPQRWDVEVSDKDSQSESNQSDVYVTPKGRKAGTWASGRIAYGYADSGGLIKNPIQIIESLLREEMGLTDNEIDVVSFNKAGAQRKPSEPSAWTYYDQWLFAGNINKKVEITKIFSQIASQCGTRVFLFDGKWYCNVWDWWHNDFSSWHEVGHLFDHTNIEDGSIDFNPKATNVYDTFEINYGYSADINGYKMETVYANRDGTNWNPSSWFTNNGYTVDWVKNKCITAHSTHNGETDNTKFNKKIINANWILHPETANNLLYYEVQKYTKPWAEISFKTNLIGLKLRPTDAIKINVYDVIPERYNNKVYEVISISPPDIKNKVTIKAICTEQSYH